MEPFHYREGVRDPGPLGPGYSNMEAFTCRPLSSCSDCLDIEGPPVKTSIFDPSPLMIYAESLARLLNKPEIIQRLEKIKKMKCKHAIHHSSISIIHELTEFWATNLLTFGENTLLKFYYHFKSENIDFDVVDDDDIFHQQRSSFSAI